MPDMRFEFYPYLRSNVLQVLDDWDHIDFDPDYQRKSGAWNLEKKQYFVDSIINGMDLTKFYFHERSPDSRDSQTVNYGVIDGKQRLEAIRSFAQDQFPLSREFEYLHGDRGSAAGFRYSELLATFPELRARFDDTMLPIVVMRADDEVFIEGLFVRLNEQASLNAAEKRMPLVDRSRSLSGNLPSTSFLRSACLSKMVAIATASYPQNSCGSSMRIGL